MGIDQQINEWLTPVADGLAAVVFFKVPVGGAQLPLIVLWLVAFVPATLRRWLLGKSRSNKCLKKPRRPSRLMRKRRKSHPSFRPN